MLAKKADGRLDALQRLTEESRNLMAKFINLIIGKAAAKNKEKGPDPAPPQALVEAPKDDGAK